MTQQQVKSIEQRGYAHPETLVSTQWVAEHLKETDRYRIAEVDEDVLLYDTGHIPNAVKLDWHTHLNDPVRRDFVQPETFARLMDKIGVKNDTTVILYGDRNNWWAAYAYWIFHLNGHTNVKIMDGGRKKWIDEGRELTKDVPSFSGSGYKPNQANPKIRAFREDVLEHIGGRQPQPTSTRPLVDVRSPGEYSGELMHMPDYPQEGTLRGGHIPSARNIPWAKAVDPDTATFKSADELKQLYGGEGVTPDSDVVVYCRIGERSSHTWFVLHELLGYPNVRNYDGSWTEWGNAVGLPIERSAGS